MAIDIVTLKTQGSQAYIDTSIKVGDINIYQFMSMAESGGGHFRDGYFLAQYKRELDYISRRQQAYYRNFVKPIVRAMVEPVFSDVELGQVVDVNDEQVFDTKGNAFIENVDRAGNDFQVITEDAVKLGRLHGVSFAVVENVPVDMMPESDREAIKQRAFPYVYIKEAWEVFADETKLDNAGNLEYITFIDEPVKDRHGMQERWRKWTRTYSVLIKRGRFGRYEEIPETRIDHNLGIVPVVVTYSEAKANRKKVLADPPLYDLAKTNYTIFNKDSEIREVERAQGFSFFYAQGVDGASVESGVNNYFNVPFQATLAPNYASPDAAIPKELRESGEQIRMSLFQIAEQNGVTGVQNQQSGIAKEWDFFAHESVLQRTAAMAEKFQDSVMDIFNLYLSGDDDYFYSIEYKDSYSPLNEMVELEKIEKYIDLSPAAKGAAMARFKAFQLLFPNATDEEIEEVQTAEEMAQVSPTETGGKIDIDNPEF